MFRDRRITKDIRRKKYLNPIDIKDLKKKGRELDKLRDDAESERKKRADVMAD